MPPADVTAAPDEAASPPPSHPEEMRGAFELNVGRFVSLRGSYRLTPADIICWGVATSAILLATAAIVRAKRR